MATQEDVRRIALSLPGALEDPGRTFAFQVDGRSFAWAWLERVHPKRARVPSDLVIAVSVAHESEKEILIEMDPDVFFTEAHYDGYPAILVRLAPIDPDLLRTILTGGWTARASKQRRAAEDRA